jgi:hypothetical protein
MGSNLSKANDEISNAAFDDRFFVKFNNAVKVYKINRFSVRALLIYCKTVKL